MYNKQFTLPLNNINNAFEKQEELSRNNYILTVRAPRIISREHSIQFEKKNYFSVNNDLQTLYFNHKTTHLVMKHLDRTLYATIDDDIYLSKEIPNQKLFSHRIDVEHTEIKEKKKP